MKTYQECNIFEKLYRRIRYQPYYFLVALWCAFKQIARLVFKMQLDCAESPKSIFILLYREWQWKANWYYKLEEVLKEI